MARLRLPDPVRDLRLGEGGVWTMGGTTITHIDPTRNRVAGTVSFVDGVSSFGVGAGAVWVETISSGRDAVPIHRVDPATDRITASGPFFLRAVGPDSLWGAGSWDHHDGFARIDPRTLRPAGSILPFEEEPGIIAFGDHDVWFGRVVLPCDRDPPVGSFAFVRVDPSSLRATTGPTFIGDHFFSSPVFAGHAMWLEGYSGLIRIDVEKASRVPPTTIAGLPPPARVQTS